MTKPLKFNIIIRDIAILLGCIELIFTKSSSTIVSVLQEVNLGIWGIIFLMDMFLIKAEGQSSSASLTLYKNYDIIFI